MGNNLSLTKKCINCERKYGDYGIDYMCYFIGKGKYDGKYMCFNCLNDKLINKIKNSDNNNLIIDYDNFLANNNTFKDLR
tara:strand:- start:568 stop:807 length:240 start_codon:yes stop_codon:yes gene_type:complete